MIIFLWIIDLIIPITMIILGAFFSNKPPKTINNYYGYRTRRSKISQKTWIYANKRCGSLYFKIGLILLILTLVADSLILIVTGKSLAPDAKGFLTIIYVLIGMIGCILPLPIVESELGRNFDSNGNEKDN